MILLDGILSPGQLIIPALMLATDLSFLLGSFKLNQSDEPSPSKKKKINLSSIKRKTPTIMGWIYTVNTRLRSLKFKNTSMSGRVAAAAAAAAKSLHSCPTLCDPIDGSPPGSPVPGILLARTMEWVAISLSNASK